MSVTQQASHVNQMNNNNKFCTTMKEDITVDALEIKLELIKNVYNEFLNNQRDLEEITENNELKTQFKVRTEFEDNYFQCVVMIQERMKKLKDVESAKRIAANGQEDNRGPRQQEVKLPRIELLPFSGKYEHWATFHDLFSSLIDENKNISNVQKLHYLKSNVLGDAESLIRSITITEANYEIAWNKLKDRYDHKRFIVDSLLKNFFAQPKIVNENHTEIKQLIDKSSEIIQSLRLQGVQIGTWDPIIVHVIVSKLDTETHKQWELKQKKDELPKFSELEEFLQGRWQSLEMILGNNCKVQQQQFNRNNYNKDWNRISGNNKKSFSSSDYQSPRSDNKCLGCNENGHRLYSCPKYSGLNLSDRKNLLKSNKLCFNCLGNGHTLGDCQNPSRCKSCKGKHHTSIHVDNANSPASSSNGSQNQTDRKSTALTSLVNGTKKVLLATAIVYVYTADGEKVPAKALIDLGSENTILSTAMANRLKLHSKPDNTTIVGIGDVEVPNRSMAINLKISSHIDPSFVMEVVSSTMDKIVGELPFIPVHRQEWPHLKGIQFADPHFDRPSPIDVLLGAEVFEEIIQDGIIHKKESSPTAMNSRLGWLLFGAVEIGDKYKAIRKSTLVTATLSARDDELNKTLKSFWEQEEIPEIRQLTVKERQAEDIFLKSVHQNEDGRYVVELPFDPALQALEIGESRKAALHGLFSLEARFRNNNELRNRYGEYIRALIEAKHIELVPKNRMNVPDSEKFYLPHHAVLKEESQTTKLRVVFDASRKSSTGVSLNEKLLVGPKTQEDLFNILIRWRKHLYTFLADIEKMYRQVKLVDEHRDYQRLLWRFDANGPILEYRITTVIDGTASAAFLATRTLNKLAEDQFANYPKASTIVKEDFYVDNLVSGSHSIEAAKQLQKEITKIMKKGNLRLRQWFSNESKIIEEVPIEDRQNSATALVEIVQNTVKTLGIFWNHKQDAFEFKITPMTTKDKLTKRELLSDISKLFDPIGWLAPSTIKAKILMQSLWEIRKLG